MKNLEHHFAENLLITTSGHESETQPSNSVRQYSDPIIVDLLIDVLSRLPGKSIARFRCVSKLWAALLRRLDFTELFLTKSLTRPRLFFTVKVNGKSFFYSSLLPQNPDENSSLVATRYYASFPKYFLTAMYTGTVCGMVLLQGDRRRKVREICNPATGEFLTLPKVIANSSSNPTKVSKMYLGYDPISKQFKVLCMTSPLYGRPGTHKVMTLETGRSLWRTIEERFLFLENGRMCGEVCINGVLYFGAKFGRSSVIVCFDVRSEKFGFINTNEDMEVGSPYVGDTLTLFNYKGKLGIHDAGEVFGVEGHLVLWVLEDAGNHKWSKHVYELPPLVNRNRFVGMTCTGEIVWLSDKVKLSNMFYVFLYNFETRTLTRLNIQGFGESNHDHHIVDTFVDYVENMKFL